MHNCGGGNTLTENQIYKLAERAAYWLDQANTEMLDMVGKRIQKIANAETYASLKNVTGDMAALDKSISNAYDKVTADVLRSYEAVAKDVLSTAKPSYKAAGVDFVPYDDNIAVQRTVKAMARQTAGTYNNLSNTLAFATSEGGKVAYTPLAKMYQDVVDEAITFAQSGVTDYKSAIRGSLKKMADSGIRQVDYESGYSRRIDSAIRQNVLDGMKQLSMDVAEQTGQELGADGYEISYHSNPRPSHEEMGGRQYAIGGAVTIDGVYYPSFDEVEELLNDFNCLHFKHPVLLGVSETAYDKAELERLKRNDAATIEFEGQKMTRYEASQIQRKLETEIRKQKDRAVIFKAAGDEIDRRITQGKINVLSNKYSEVSKKFKIPTKLDRMMVAGFTPLKEV